MSVKEQFTFIKLLFKALVRNSALKRSHYEA